MTAIQWEEPPPPAIPATAQTSDRLREFADALLNNPGRWALYPGDLKSKDSATQTAKNIRRGVARVWQPQGHFEAAARTVDGAHKVYVRYIGEPT